MKGICNCDSAQIGDINRHIKTVHEEKRYCKCEPCDTKFANKGTEQTHNSSSLRTEVIYMRNVSCKVFTKGNT